MIFFYLQSNYVPVEDGTVWKALVHIGPSSGLSAQVFQYSAAVIYLGNVQCCVCRHSIRVNWACESWEGPASPGTRVVQATLRMSSSVSSTRYPVWNFQGPPWVDRRRDVSRIIICKYCSAALTRRNSN
jgi:hypothetical protein